MKISAVIADDVAAKLKQRALAEDRSMGAVIRRAIADHVQRPADVDAVSPIEDKRKDGDGR